MAPLSWKVWRTFHRLADLGGRTTTTCLLRLPIQHSIVCANHTNSLTDALCDPSFIPTLRSNCYSESLLLQFHRRYVYHITNLILITQTVSVKRRNMLHLTAKSTQFGKKTLTSWLIEAAGTVPIQRRKDFAEGAANNDVPLEKLTQVRALVSHGTVF